MVLCKYMRSYIKYCILFVLILIGAFLFYYYQIRAKEIIARCNEYALQAVSKDKNGFWGPIKGNTYNGYYTQCTRKNQL